jgi:hypothetical protein
MQSTPYSNMESRVYHANHQKQHQAEGAESGRCGIVAGAYRQQLDPRIRLKMSSKSSIVSDAQDETT